MVFTFNSTTMSFFTHPPLFTHLCTLIKGPSINDVMNILIGYDNWNCPHYPTKFRYIDAKICLQLQVIHSGNCATDKCQFTVFPADVVGFFHHLLGVRRLSPEGSASI